MADNDERKNSEKLQELLGFDEAADNQYPTLFPFMIGPGSGPKASRMFRVKPLMKVMGLTHLYLSFDSGVY
jgi:hypothetical protein